MWTRIRRNRRQPAPRRRHIQTGVRNRFDDQSLGGRLLERQLRVVDRGERLVLHVFPRYEFVHDRIEEHAVDFARGLGAVDRQSLDLGQLDEVLIQRVGHATLRRIGLHPQIRLRTAQRFDRHYQARRFAEQMVCGRHGVHAAGHPLGARERDRVGRVLRVHLLRDDVADVAQEAHDQKHADDRDQRHQRELALACGTACGGTLRPPRGESIRAFHSRFLSSCGCRAGPRWGSSRSRKC